MYQPQIFEGQWEDIHLRKSTQLRGQWVKVSVESKNFDSTKRLSINKLRKLVNICYSYIWMVKISFASFMG